MPHTREISFHRKPLSNKLVVGSTLIIIQQESEKMIWKADFGLKFLRRVRFWIKNFTTRQILKKNIILKSMILKKNNFSESTILKFFWKKSTILKKICSQKITFCFNLPRKMRKFYVLRAYLDSTILKKKEFLKSMILKKNFFLKSMILNEIVFVKSMILN